MEEIEMDYPSASGNAYYIHIIVIRFRTHNELL
jgi:hypothetical protein